MKKSIKIKLARNQQSKVVQLSVMPYFDELKKPDKHHAEGAHEQMDVSFEQAIWPIIAVGQICGIMPITGIRPSSRKSNLHFKWRSFRTVCSAIYLTLGTIITYLYLKRLKAGGIKAKNLGGALFFVFSLIAYLLFFVLAKKWRDIIKQWNEMDSIFLRYPYKLCGWRLSFKIRVIAAFFICIALSEHTIYLVQKVYVYHVQIERCKWNIDDYWRNFFTAEHNHVFEVVPYSVPLAMIVVWINTTCIISWSFADMFIMLVSIGISTRFKQINQRLAQIRGKSVPDSTWTSIRQDYVQICELMDFIDEHISPIIVLSCSNNLYFICFQLLNIFEKLPYFLNYLYFWYSLVFLIGRTICVFLAAGTIHEASKRPVSDIRAINTPNWGAEADRFFEQVTTENIALSGMKFFFLTRKVLLGMIGTIVTYELVLLQFEKATAKDDVDDTQLERFCHHVRVRVS